MITQLEGELVGSGVDWIDLKLVGITVRVFVPENTVDGRNLTDGLLRVCLLYTSPSPRDLSTSRMPSSA